MPELGSSQSVTKAEPATLGRAGQAGTLRPAALSKADCRGGSRSADSLENSVNVKQTCRVSSK